MNPATDRLQYLLQAWTSGTGTNSETAELFAWIDTHEEPAAVEEHVNVLLGDDKLMEGTPPVDWEALYMRIRERSEKEVPVIAMEEWKEKKKKRSWYWVAAAVLLAVVGAAGYFVIRGPQKIENTIVQAEKVNDKEPGKDGAILTLGNGQQLVLDSLANGIVASDNGTKINLDQNRITYTPTDAERTVMNTLSTPRGRQFQLLLPDGTRAWLNAASSLTYPTAFTGNTREVAVTGEVYFEVAKDARKPFIVKVDENTSVEVLGTHFNINAYSDEASINTTLLEGKVKIVSTAGPTTLIPGKQAQVQNGNIKVIDADTEKVMAWKNGLFNFDGQSLEETMRQLSRWYDIQVTYENQIPEIRFGGEMSRNISLQGVLKGLKGAGVKFRLEGNTLIVSP